MKSFLIRSFVVLAAVIGANGCVAIVAGAAAGGGTAVYVKGQLKDTLDGTVQEVHRAARRALEETGLHIREDLVDEYSGSLEGEYADGTNAWVKTESVSARTTRITIRAGYMGDQKMAADILERTKRNLYGL